VPDRQNHVSFAGHEPRYEAVELPLGPSLGEEGWAQDHYAYPSMSQSLVNLFPQRIAKHKFVFVKPNAVPRS
jgi:hypothetical protein